MVQVDRYARTAARRLTCGWIAVTAAALVLAMVGCSNDDAAAPSTSTSAETSTTTGSTDSTTSSSTTAENDSTSSTEPNSESLEEEIIARYIGYWEARLEANTGTPNPDDPALREFATGEQLAAVIAETKANLDQGLAIRLPDDPADIQQVTVIEVEGDGAVVQECVVSDEVLFDRGTGEVVNDMVATHSVRGELLFVDGEWRVASAQLIQRWEGVAGCVRES